MNQSGMHLGKLALELFSRSDSRHGVPCFHGPEILD